MTSEYPWKQSTDEWGLIVPIENCFIGGWPYTNPHIATENPIHIVPCMGLMELGPPGSQRLGWGRYFMYTISTKWTISITQTKIQRYTYLVQSCFALKILLDKPVCTKSEHLVGCCFPSYTVEIAVRNSEDNCFLFGQSSDSSTVTFCLWKVYLHGLSRWNCCPPIGNNKNWTRLILKRAVLTLWVIA